MIKEKKAIADGGILRGTVVSYEGGYYVSLLNTNPNGKNCFLLLDGITPNGKFRRIYPSEKVMVSDVKITRNRGDVPVDVLYIKYFVSDNITISEKEFDTYMSLSVLSHVKYFISLCIMRSLPKIQERNKALVNSKMLK